MTYRSQSGSRKGGQKFQKSSHEKAKNKPKKQKINSANYAPEQPVQSSGQIAEKTLLSLNRLGNQTFALSPFSQYFDEWLMNLNLTVSEFESNPQIKTDEQWTKERAQIFGDVEAALAEGRIKENTLSDEAKALHTNNHLLGDMDAQYAEKNRELSNKRNIDVQQFSSRTRQLEDELAQEKQVKVGRFSFGAKRKNAQNLSRLTKDLATAKSGLELALDNFKVEQEKLHDDYEVRKQAVISLIRELELKLEKLETDPSTAARKTTCESLSKSLNDALQRNPAAPQPAES
jgi:hypothetical protein